MKKVIFIIAVICTICAHTINVEAKNGPTKTKIIVKNKEVKLTRHASHNLNKFRIKKY